MYALILNSLRLSFSAAIVKISFYSWLAVCLNYSPAFKSPHRSAALQESSHRSIRFLEVGSSLLRGWSGTGLMMVLTSPQSTFTPAHGLGLVFLHQYDNSHHGSDE